MSKRRKGLSLDEKRKVMLSIMREDVRPELNLLWRDDVITHHKTIMSGYCCFVCLLF